MTPPSWRLLAAFAILPAIQAVVAYFSFPLVWQLGPHGNARLALYVLGLVRPATAAHLAMGTMSQHLLPASELLIGALRTIVIGSAFGMMSAATFWFIGVWPGPAR